MHDGDPKRADRKAELLAAFFLRTRLATGRRRGFGTTGSRHHGPAGEIGARARHGYASAQARCVQLLAPWCAGSEGRLG
jgi:hypothetical protein